MFQGTPYTETMDALTHATPKSWVDEMVDVLAEVYDMIAQGFRQTNPPQKIEQTVPNTNTHTAYSSTTTK